LITVGHNKVNPHTSFKGKNMKVPTALAGLLAGWLISMAAPAANTVPTDVQMPGTQPGEIGALESPNKCDNCHGGYNSAVEPAHNWRGSMMAHAGRDPIFWATLAVAEQDFDGAGDLCIRCHSTGGWLAGRSTPTDGAGLAAGDSDGVECDYCHKLTNPNDQEHQGNQFDPFRAHSGEAPAPEGYYGSGMSSLWGGSDKLGPYNDAEARHQFMQSNFHRDVDFCGTCHDVSNPVTGDLAHNHGQMQPSEEDPVIASGIPGAPVDGKAAFNNPPYRYGIVERTFSEYKSGLISQTPVQNFFSLPGELQGGVLQAVYEAATQGGPPSSANYQNPPATRYFSCQSCHLRPVTGKGANKNGVPTRTDLPLHDMTGGNYWMPAVIDYLNGLGQLRLGGNMTDAMIAAMYDGAARALEQLQLAATLSVHDDGEQIEVEIVNHTGHKLITGYPEGRRMWLNVKWYDAGGTLLREDGAYGDLAVTLPGQPLTVRSILDLDDPNTKIYEAHMGMTQEWAFQLLGLGYSPDLALAYDRVTGQPSHTLGELAGGSPGSTLETFHFVLNNVVVKDNRIPPYGMDYAEAKKRNALPVPATQYGCEAVPCDHYEHHDEIYLDDPPGAETATIDLMYQPTSWEYIQFLALANDGSNAFLGDEGAIMLDAWLNNGMAEPVVMASAAWGAPPEPCETPVPTVPVIDEAVAGDKEVTLHWVADGTADNYTIYLDQSGKAQFVATSDCTSGPCSYTHTGLTNGQEYCYMLTATAGCATSDFSDIVCATPQPPGQQEVAGVATLVMGMYVKTGKGKDATTEWVETSNFEQGDKVVFRGRIVDAGGVPLPGANFHLDITGPESNSVSSGSSDADGYAEAIWSTRRPKGGGDGGTALGAYTGTVTDVSAAAHSWDEVPTQAEFSIGPPGAGPHSHGAFRAGGHSGHPAAGRFSANFPGATDDSG
jgi:hypothetical protein